MSRVVLFALACLIVVPATAQQDDAEPRQQIEEGMNLMSRAARMLMQGLMREFEPQMEELKGLVEKLDAYHPPEMLPNGDIIIRRKTPAEIGPPAEGEIDI